MIVKDKYRVQWYQKNNRWFTQCVIAST